MTAPAPDVEGLAWEGSVLRLENDLAVARVALQGAQVLTYAPRGGAPVLWLSRRAVFAPGKAVRGGIPVCWPWFGPHPTDPSKPAHGFARTAIWTLEAASRTTDGGHELVLSLPPRAGAACGWTYPVELNLTITIGSALGLALCSRNNGSAPVVIGGALHSYFSVGDVGKIRILGLEGKSFVDQLAPSETKSEPVPIGIAGETDRVYDDPGPQSVIDDELLARRIFIEKTGSRSTVVWNPWLEKGRRLADVGQDQVRDFVCVETANALKNVVTLPPGGEHRLGLVIRAEEY
jgi:D-hexose-6-phosphate mutarotase